MKGESPGWGQKPYFGGLGTRTHVRTCHSFWSISTQEFGSVRGPGRLKTSFHEFWKHFRGEETEEGRDCCICAGGGATGQSCLAPTRSPVRGRLKRPGSMVSEPIEEFSKRAVCQSTQNFCVVARQSRPPLGKADTTPRLSEAELNGPPGPRGAEQKSQKLPRSRRPGSQQKESGMPRD